MEVATDIMDFKYTEKNRRNNSKNNKHNTKNNKNSKNKDGDDSSVSEMIHGLKDIGKQVYMNDKYQL